MIYEMRCPGTNFEKPGILTPVTDGTAIFPSVPAAIFTITDQTKERYKKLHAFQSPGGRLVSRREIGIPKGDWSSRREIGKHGVYLQIFRFGESESLRFSPACYCEITPRTPFVGV